MGPAVSARVPVLPFLATCALGSLAVGLLLLVKSVPGVGVGDVLRAIAYGVGIGADSVPVGHVAIVFDVRLPRILVAVFAGAALALAGTVMQAVFRNPLASPDVMGTHAGSALGAVLAIGLGLASHSVLAAPALAFLGAIAVSAVVYLAAAGRGGASVTGILLAGMAMNALVGAATVFVVSLFWYGDYTRSGAVLQWLLGGLDLATMQRAAIVAGGLVLFGAALVPFLRDLDLLTLRDESAGSLGVNVARLRQGLLVIACGITATTVSCTGGIVFVGLVVPHMVRLLVGPAHRALAPCAAAGGALILLLADAICQLAPSALDLRAGVVTAGLGAPFFLYLLARHRRGYAL